MINYVDKNLVTATVYSTIAPLGLTVVSLAEIFVVVVIIPKLSDEAIMSSHYFTYLKAKDLKDILWGLVPIIGNIYCFIHRFEITLEMLKRSPSCLRDAYFINFWKELPDQSLVIYENPAIFDYLTKELQKDFIRKHGNSINSFLDNTYVFYRDLGYSSEIAMKWLTFHPDFFKHLTLHNTEKVKLLLEKHTNKYKSTILYKLLFWNQQRSPAEAEKLKAQKKAEPELDYLKEKYSAEEIRKCFKNNQDIFHRQPSYFSFNTNKTPHNSDTLWEDSKFIAYIAEEPKALAFMNQLSKNILPRQTFKEKIIELACKDPLIIKNINQANPFILIDDHDKIIDASPEILFHLDNTELGYLESTKTPEYYLRRHKGYLYANYRDRMMLRIIYDKDLSSWKYLSNPAFNEPEVIEAFKNLSIEERGVVLVHIGDRAPKNLYKLEDDEIKQLKKLMLSGKDDDPLLLQCLPLIPESSAFSHQRLVAFLMHTCLPSRMKYVILSLDKNLLEDQGFNPNNWRENLTVIREVFAIKPELLHHLCDEKGKKFADNLSFIKSLNDGRFFVCAAKSALEKMNEKEWNQLMLSIQKKSFPWRDFPPSKDFMDKLSEAKPKILEEILSHIIDIKQLSLLLLCQKAYNKEQNESNYALPKPIVTKIFLHQYSLNPNLLYTLYEMMNPKKKNKEENKKTLSIKNISTIPAKKTTVIQKITIIASSAKAFFRKLFNK